MPVPAASDTPPPSKHVGALTVVIAIIAVIMAAAGWFYFTAPSPARFQAVVDSLQTGDLKSAQTGRIDIAATFPSLTPRNEIYITRRADGSLLALFPTYYNTGTDIGGLMFTSRPLRETDVYERSRGVELDRRLIDIGNERKLDIDRRIDDHWYKVSKGLE